MSATTAPPAPRGTAASPLVEAILAGKAPQPVRLAAARGALPVTRPERLQLCVHLRGDPDPAVSRTAEGRLAAEGRADLAASLEAGESLVPEVLEHYARRADTEPAVLEKLAVEPALTDAALEELARCPHPAVLERIVINQTRLLGDPEVVRRLDANPRLSANGRRLLVEFKHDFWEKGTHNLELTGAQAPAVEEPPQAPEPGEQAAPEDAGAASEAAPVELTPEEATDEVFKAAYVRIMQMTVPQKIQLSVKATREERTVLVRDSNRQVATSVLRSPKLTEQEIDSIANMRNVSDEVLRIIATNKTWTRNYAVIHALARNPKTPVGLALPFLNRLNTRDIKNMLSDKNISEALRKMCKRVFEQRNEATQPSKKK